MEADEGAGIMDLKAPETLNVAEWLLSVRYCGSTLATKYYNDGLNSKFDFYIKDNVEAAQPENFVPLLRPVYPVNGNEAAIAEWEYLLKVYYCTKEAIALFKHLIIQSLSPAIKALLRDPVCGYSRLSIRDIIMFVLNNYGQLTSDDINTVYSRLEAPCSDAHAFALKGSEMVQDFAILKSSGISVPEWTKQKLVYDKFKTCPQVLQHIQQYAINVPVWSTRTMASLIRYVSQMLVNAYSATMHQCSYVQVDSIQSIVDTAAKVALAARNISKPITDKSDSAACGCPSHDGKLCNALCNNTKNYTGEHRNAITPVTINDVMGSFEVLVPSANPSPPQHTDESVVSPIHTQESMISFIW